MLTDVTSTPRVTFRGMSQDVADEAPVPSPPRKRQRQRSMSNGVTGGLTKYLALDCEMVRVCVVMAVCVQPK